MHSLANSLGRVISRKVCLQKRVHSLPQSAIINAYQGKFISTSFFFTDLEMELVCSRELSLSLVDTSFHFES